MSISSASLVKPFEDTLAALLPALKSRAAEVAEYAATRADILADLVGDPDFDQALRAETDSLMLHAAVAAVNAGKDTDSALRTAISSVFHFAATTLITAA